MDGYTSFWNIYSEFSPLFVVRKIHPQCICVKNNAISCCWPWATVSLHFAVCSSFEAGWQTSDCMHQNIPPHVIRTPLSMTYTTHQNVTTRIISLQSYLIYFRGFKTSSQTQQGCASFRTELSILNSSAFPEFEMRSGSRITIWIRTQGSIIAMNWNSNKYDRQFKLEKSMFKMITTFVW